MNKHINKRRVVKKAVDSAPQKPDFSRMKIVVESQKTGDTVTLDEQRRRLVLQALQFNGVLMTAQQMAEGFGVEASVIEADIDYLRELQSTVCCRFVVAPDPKQVSDETVKDVVS